MNFGIKNLLLIAGGACALPAAAHHSFSSVFDGSKPIEVTGVISKLEWLNPHSYLYLTVNGKRGKTEHWSFESLPPYMFKRAGLKREMLPVGDTVTVIGYGARDGTKTLGWIKKLRFADGREIQVTADNPADAKFSDVK